MLTKAQKKEHVELSAQKIKASKNIVFADFTGVGTADVNNLKKELRKAGAEFKVVKKRLLKIALKEAGIEFDPSSNKAPIATVYTPTDLTSVAGPIYKFSRELAKRKINFKVLAAYDAEAKKLLNTAEFTVIAKLPNRETLLAMVIGAMTGPLRAFMSIVQQLAERPQTNLPAGQAGADVTQTNAEKIATPTVETLPPEAGKKVETK